MTALSHPMLRRLRPAVLAACAIAAAGTTGSALGQDLGQLLADTSIIGTNIAGEPFCTFYADNGTSVTTSPGAAPQQGTWTIDDGRVCETRGGLSWCSRFEFHPPTYETVTVTSLEGSGSFPITANVASHNNCNAVTASAPASVNGYSVSEVVFSGGGAPLGGYRSVGGGQWVELGAAGNVTFHFVETARDDWSVYLLDQSRAVEIQLDLHTKMVMYNQVGQARQPLYHITDAR